MKFLSEIYYIVRLYLIYFIFESFTSLKEVEALQPYLHTELDYATSPIDIKNLMVVESHIVFELLKVLKNVQDCNGAKRENSSELEESAIPCELQLAPINGYVSEFEATLLKDVGLDLSTFETLHSRSIIDLHGFGADAAKHPFKIFRTIRRCVKQLPAILNLPIDPGLTKKIQSYQKIQKFPRESDLETSILNILRLNQLFKLPFQEFVSGKLSNIQTNCGLTSEHLVEIGHVATAKNFYSQAVDAYAIALWNEVIISRNQNHSDNSDKRLDLKEIYDLLEEAIARHDKKIQGSILDEDIQPDSGPLFFNHLLHNIRHQNFKYRTPVTLDTLLPHYANYPDDDVRLKFIQYGFAFEQLCRGEDLKCPQETSKLKCYLVPWFKYVSNTKLKIHPVFILSTLKVEVHNEDPFILQYHDVLREEEMQRLKDEVKSELRMSRTIRSLGMEKDEDNLLGETSRHRTSSNAWIEDYDHKEFGELLNKVGRMLRVNVKRNTASENMQIAAYSPGGHYVPHTDAVFETEVLDLLDPSEFLRGDRLLTFMLYVIELSDVEGGGSTVFPILKTGISPSKGSAVMWYNIHPDGTIDRRTLHGGCSVIYGVKWIANKWIRSDDQMFLRRCPSSNPSNWDLGIHI